MIFESIIEDMTTEDFNEVVIKDEYTEGELAEGTLEVLTAESKIDATTDKVIEGINVLNVMSTNLDKHEETMTAESHENLKTVMETIAGVNGLTSKDIFGDVTEFTTEAAEKEKGSATDRVKKVGKAIIASIKKRIAEIGGFISTMLSKVGVYLSASDKKREALLKAMGGVSSVKKIDESYTKKGKGLIPKAVDVLMTFDDKFGVYATIKDDDIKTNYDASKLPKGDIVSTMIVARGKVIVTVKGEKDESVVTLDLNKANVANFKNAKTINSKTINAVKKELGKSKKAIGGEVNKAVKYSKVLIRKVEKDIKDGKANVSDLIKEIGVANVTSRSVLKTMRDSIYLSTLIAKSEGIKLEEPKALPAPSNSGKEDTTKDDDKTKEQFKGEDIPKEESKTEFSSFQ